MRRWAGLLLVLLALLAVSVRAQEEVEVEVEVEEAAAPEVEAPPAVADTAVHEDFEAQAHELFALVDTDGSGSLSCRELRYAECSSDLGPGGTVGVSIFPRLMQTLAERNGREPAEFLSQALRYQRTGVAQTTGEL